MSLPSDTACDSDSSNDFSDVSLYFLEDEFDSPQTPLPTNDSAQISEISVDKWGLSGDREFELLELSTNTERPETSTSSLFSFVTGNENIAPPSPFAIRLPTFTVSENSGFYNSESASDQFGSWLEICSPHGGTFAEAAAEELTKNPRIVRSEPALPSLFRRREYGCGYCRSIGYRGWETHTRQKCAQLSRLAPCRVCGATGPLNHTETYCPEKPSVALPFLQEFIEGSEERRPSRSQGIFHKYSSLINLIYPCPDIQF
ncbi:unnamed protein product [Caenorhabditis sp. 36 PRJEB53466]|nr:unnamed protein product [Caenorhabditis sp. 36 PRJEB53466]